MSLPKYREYKDSGAAWLGEVPCHWDLVPLWSVFRRNKRTGFPDEELLSATGITALCRKRAGTTISTMPRKT